MIKAIALGLLSPIIPVIISCTGIAFSTGHPQVPAESLLANFWASEWNSIKEDYDDLNQEIQIFAADGELRLTITENEQIFVFIKSLELDKWDYSLQEIPPDALKLCTRVSYLEQDGKMVIQAISTVYSDQNGHYNLTDAPGGTSQNKMSEPAARYLIALAGLELSGTEKFSEHKLVLFNEDYNTTNDTGAAGYQPPFAGLTYEDMLAASAENLIELHKDGTVIQSISDNQGVYQFLLSLEFNQWAMVEHIPDSVEEVCTITRYQLGRRTFEGQMLEQSRLLLYYDGTEYYMEMLITDDGSGYGNRANELYPQRFHVPKEVGDRLSVII